jgi:hypothetical protein
MTMILVINAVSSLFATVGIGGFFLQKTRRVRKAIVQPGYMASRTTRPLPRD